MITTVLGEIKKEALGVTLPHEHLLIDMRTCVDALKDAPSRFFEKMSPANRYKVACDPYAILDNALMESVECAEAELLSFKAEGGQTIVDCTPDEIGRDPHKLKALSQKTGVNIIMGCGHYYHKAHFPCVKKASVDTLASEMLNDLTVGVGNSGVKAGIIGEIGTSATVSEDEKKVLHAAGAISAQTDKAIHVHTDLYTENGHEIIKLLTMEGARRERICIDHIDVLLRPDYVRSLLNEGVFVEFDNFGKEFFLSKTRRFAYDLERIQLLKTLLDEGYGKQILVTNDICLKSMLTSYGGGGYSHVLGAVRHMALENGITAQEYDALLTENVKRFLD